jgi:hypothetical protein
MPTITRELVSRYIEGAQPFAESKTERLAIQLAAELNTPSPKRRSARNPRKEKPKKKSKTDKKIRSWQELIWQEIHAVLCTSTSRCRKQVATLKNNTDLMIWTIAAYIAGKIGIAVAVVAALVASLLRLVSSMGVSVFCKRFAAEML